jgi:hypothetical protein
MDFKEVELQGMDWIHPADGRDYGNEFLGSIKFWKCI